MRLRRARTTGYPPSPNGASSFHLRWEGDVARAPLREVSAVLEVVRPPVVDRLYFWALQASFCDSRTGRVWGGAHLGLQHHPSFPASGAANWGGYDSAGNVLEGSVSPLPSTPSDRNTRDFPWKPGVPYRLRITRSPEETSDGRAAWRGEITDTARGSTVVVRELWCPGDALAAPIVWSEVFARCDDPEAAVRWSGLQAVTEAGDLIEPEALVVSYQSHADGGCANTTVIPDGDGVIQHTATRRTVRHGAALTWVGTGDGR